MHYQDIDSLLKRNILKELFFTHTTTCATLSEELNKSIPVVTRNVNELIEEGWLEEAGFAPSKGGRRPMSYQIKAIDNYIVTVTLNRFGGRIGILNFRNELISTPKYFDLDLKKVNNPHEKLVEIIQNFIYKNKISQKDIIAIGIAMPGFINVKKGINYSYFTHVPATSIREYLSTTLNLPVYIDNDSSVIALSELKYGSAKDKKEIMVINIGWGIGLGMIVNGELYRGHFGYAGELSHIPIADSGKLCECGKRGCLETEATLKVAAETALQNIQNGTFSTLQPQIDLNSMSEYLIDAASKGNQEAIELYENIALKIGKALAILIHITNPEMIVLAGRGAKIGRILMGPIQQALNQYCIPRLYKHTKLAISEIGNEAALLGAGALAIENLD